MSWRSQLSKSPQVAAAVAEVGEGRRMARQPRWQQVGVRSVFAARPIVDKLERPFHDSTTAEVPHLAMILQVRYR